MGLRVAVATEDGIDVQHFGHATRFHVYDLDGAGISLVEKRENGPLPTPGEDRAAAHKTKVERIRDCQALIVARVGPNALRLIEEQGIAVYESQNSVTDALNELATAEGFTAASAGQGRAQ